MTTITFDINDELYQQAQNLANDRKMSLAELFNFFIQKESKTTVVEKKPELQLTPQQQADLQAIRALRGKYRQYAENTPTLSVEEMDKIARQKFAEKWLADDAYNRSLTSAESL